MASASLCNVLLLTSQLHTHERSTLLTCAMFCADVAQKNTDCKSELPECYQFVTLRPIGMDMSGHAEKQLTSFMSIPAMILSHRASTSSMSNAAGKSLEQKARKGNTSTSCLPAFMQQCDLQMCSLGLPPRWHQPQTAQNHQLGQPAGLIPVEPGFTAWWMCPLR